MGGGTSGVMKGAIPQWRRSIISLCPTLGKIYTPKNLLTVLGSAVWDHCPLLVDLDAKLDMGRRFKFESFWPKVEGFVDTV